MECRVFWSFCVTRYMFKRTQSLSNASLLSTINSNEFTKIYGVTWLWPRPLLGKYFSGTCRDYPREHACQIWSSYLHIKTGLLSNFILTRIRSLERGIGPIAAVAPYCCHGHRSRDPCHVPFPKFFQWSFQHFLGSMLANLEVCNFSHFGTISI